MTGFTAFVALCLYDFEAQDPSELSFKRGSIIKIIDSGGSGWWCAEAQGNRGWVPAIYVQRVSDGLATMLKSVREEVKIFEDNQGTLPPLSADESLPSDETRRFSLPPNANPNATIYKKPRPRYHGSELSPKLSGSPEGGTLEALVARVTTKVGNSSDEAHRHLLLLTYPSFTTGDKLLNLLIAQYELKAPAGLSPGKEQRWCHHIQHPRQAAILSLIGDWLERYGLLEDEPELAPKLMWFLSRLYDTSSADFVKNLVGPALERVFANQVQSPDPIKPMGTWERMVGNFRSINVLDLAEQITLHTARLFYKIRPRECLVWTEPHDIGSVRHLSAVNANLDKLKSWVKTSILKEGRSGARMRLFDRWVRVANHCNEIHNYASAVAIVSALSDSNIQRLQSCEKAEHWSTFVDLRSLLSPKSNLQSLRDLANSVPGPCIPFISAYLSDLTRIDDQYTDKITIPPSKEHPRGLKLINYAKCRKRVEVIDSMLRHQYNTYGINEKPRIMAYIDEHLNTSKRDDAWYLSRSRKVERSESSASSLDSASFYRNLSMRSVKLNLLT